MVSTKRSKERKEVITESGANQRNQPSLGTVALRRKSNRPVSKRKKISSAKLTQKSRSSKTSGQGLTSREKVFKPYWNAACEDLQSRLWLPHEIGFVGHHSRSCNGSSNYTEEPSSHWKKTVKPKDLMSKPCLPFLPHSAQATTENEVTGSAKIRIFPKNERAFFDLLSLHRRAYNLAIEWLRSQSKVDLRKKTDVRRAIRDHVRSEWNGRTFVSVVSDEAVNRAFETFKACLRKWKSAGQKAKLNFKSRKETTQSFVVQKLSGSGPYPRLLGPVHITEPVPSEGIGSMAIVTCRHGRWYLSVKKHITVRIRENQARTVSLDPGVRTFMTAYSPFEAIKYGDDYASRRVFPLLRKKDTLLGKRQRLVDSKCDSQWWHDQMKCVNRRIDRLSARISDQVEDLHKRVAYDLVMRYDTIICPPFETSQMVSKEGRKLRRSSVRQMQVLSHHRFQQHLKWMCRKYGRNFVSCPEAYTSKTRSWDGVVVPELGGSKTISDGEIVVDRDFNGARGIFLRAHTRQLTPYSDPNVTVGTD